MDNGLVVAKQNDATLDRNPHWPSVRANHLILESKCAVCAGTIDLQVHHVVPFHYCILIANRPDLELDHRNLITLCQDPKTDHHLIVGHLQDFHTYNPNVRADAKKSKKGFLANILDSIFSILKREPKPKLVSKMTDADKKKFIDRVNKLYPGVQVEAKYLINKSK